MFERCHNCGRRVFNGVRDKFGIFCSMVCRNNVAHPGFCNACVAATTPASAGSNIRVNGIGAVFYSTTDPCKTCGSAVQSQWFCVFFIPVFRVGRFRVKYVAPNRYLSRKLPGKPKAPPSLAAHKPDGPFPQKTTPATGALVFLSCALAFCTIAILFFRPWEKYQTLRPVEPEPEVRKAKPVPLQEQHLGLGFRPDQPLTPTEIARRASPSVVLLTMQDARGQPISLGSGFFVDKDVIATNFHVIDGAAAGYAKVIGRTAKLNIKGTVAVDALHDLALLQIDTSSTLRLPVAPKPSVNIGDAVYAIGSPKGLEGTFSQGIVSSVRTLGSDRILQITTPISPGSSGGPVLDQSANVVGVSFASIEKGQNLNFAIPSDYLAALRDSKTELRPFTVIPRAKARTTLLDRIGNERPLAGVAGENLTYDGAGFQSGQFSLSLHNKLRENVTGVFGIVIFHDVADQPIDIYPINYEGVIPAGTAKRISGHVDSSVERLNCPLQPLTLIVPPRSPRGKVEVRILNFNVE